jgi:hypothetical protein
VNSARTPLSGSRTSLGAPCAALIAYSFGALPVIGTLGEDLLLLSIRPDQGRIATLPQIDYGLMGAELVRLAASGRIDIAGNRIVVNDSAATSDAELDAIANSTGTVGTADAAVVAAVQAAIAASADCSAGAG